ncbi:MAG: lysine--tRNA ligase, partial [Candidatus Dependentiae bacterium]
PELYLKTLVVGGFDRVFEINRNFRNEGVSTRHNPEFTMLEFYQAHGTYEDGMVLTEKLFHAAAHRVHGTAKVQYGDHELDFESAFKRYTVAESLVDVGGFSEDDVCNDRIDGLLKQHGVTEVAGLSLGQKQYMLFEEAVESKLIQPTFITDFPIEVSPLAKQLENDPTHVARFELFVAGMELANSFSELNEPFEQERRFHEQAQQRAGGDDEAHFFDGDYVKALEYGLPPTVGVGIGIDRLVMLLTNTTSIKDVILFPTMKRQQGEATEK